jgi:uncharacterized membrane protein
MMRWLILIAGLAGVIVASMALGEHYNMGTSPCKINEVWDCGTVNKSQYSVFGGVPVAIIGICGYYLLGCLASMKAWRLLFPAALVGLGFSLYLTYREMFSLQVWCIYCVISQSIILLITIMALVALLMGRKRDATLAKSASS